MLNLVYVWMGECVSGWLSEWVNEWVGEWVGGWVSERISLWEIEYTYIYRNSPCIARVLHYLVPISCTWPCPPVFHRAKNVVEIFPVVILLSFKQAIFRCWLYHCCFKITVNSNVPTYAKVCWPKLNFFCCLGDCSIDQRLFIAGNVLPICNWLFLFVAHTKCIRYTIF